MNAPAYAELHCLSNFTFLHGASFPEELVVSSEKLLHVHESLGALRGVLFLLCFIHSHVFGCFFKGSVGIVLMVFFSLDPAT